MAARLRIFLSSPGDVNQERLRALLIIQKLASDYQSYFTIEPFLWEYEPLLASKHFQDAIDPPSSFDIFLLFAPRQAAAGKDRAAGISRHRRARARHRQRVGVRGRPQGEPRYRRQGTARSTGLSPHRRREGDAG